MTELKGILIFNRYLIVYIFMALISVIFLNVFMVDQGLHDATHTGKIIFLLRFIPYLVLLALPFLIYQVKKQLDLLSLLVLTFYGWMLVVGKPGGLWYDEKFLCWTVGTVFFFITRTCITFGKNNREKIHPLWMPVVMLSVTAGVEAVLGQLQVFGWFQIYHGIYKVSGTFFNPAPYAGFLVGCLPYALTVANPCERTKLTHLLSWLGLFSTMLIVSILPATQSRAGWLGTGAVGAVWLFYHFKLPERLSALQTNRGSLLLATSALAFIFILAAGYGLYHFKKDSADGRLLIWKASSQLVKAQPLTGYGFNTFQANYAPALADYFSSGGGTKQEEILAGNVRWAFNEPLQYTIELGILGLLLFLGIVGYALICPLKETIRITPSGEEIIHQKKQWVYTARASLIGIFVFGWFSYPFHSPAITLLFFFALAVVAGYVKGIRLKYFETTIQGLILLLVSVFAIYSFLQAPKFQKAYWLWDEAKLLYQIKVYEAANKSFEKAKPILQTDGLFMQQYGKSLYMARDYQKAASILEAGGRYYKDDFWYIIMGDTYHALGAPEKAEQCYQTASRMVPHKLYPKYLLTKLYDTNDQWQKAYGLANDILTSEVKVMSTAVKEIQQEIRDILNKQMVELGDEERKASRETHSPSTPSPLPKGKEVQR